MPSNKEPSLTRPTLIDLHPVKFNHYPLMISHDKCNGSCNAADLQMPVFLMKQKMEIVKYLIW